MKLTETIGNVVETSRAIASASLGGTVFRRDYWTQDGRHIMSPRRGGISQIVNPASFQIAQHTNEAIRRAGPNGGTAIDMGRAIGALATTAAVVASGEPIGHTLLVAGSLWLGTNALINSVFIAGPKIESAIRTHVLHSGGDEKLTKAQARLKLNRQQRSATHVVS